MKKYRLMFMAVVIIYIFVWALGNYMLTGRKREKDSLHMIEINRLYKEYILCLKEDNNSSFADNNDILRINEHNYKDISEYKVKKGKYVQYIMYKNAGLPSDVREENAFYYTRNGYCYIIKPVIEGDNTIGYLRFDYVPVKSDDRILWNYNIMAAVLGILSIFTLMYIYRYIIRPFDKMSNVSYELAKGNFNYEIKEEKGKYFGRFIWGINMLKDTLEYHKKRELKLARDKKMILLSISHDIKTPLNIIDLYAKALGNNMYKNEEERKIATEKISEKVSEIDVFVKDIVKSSSEDIVIIEVNNKEFYTNELVRKVKNGYEEKCIINHVKFSVGKYDNLLLYGDVDKLYEVLGNIMENAFKYGNGVEISITFEIEENYMLITVYNSGDVVEANEMSHLFDSFFRGKNAENKQGNGLGLYICREIMRNMEGEIYASAEDNGMKFTVVTKISG